MSVPTLFFRRSCPPPLSRLLRRKFSFWSRHLASIAWQQQSMASNPEARPTLLLGFVQHRARIARRHPFFSFSPSPQYPSIVAQSYLGRQKKRDPSSWVAPPPPLLYGPGLAWQRASKWRDVVQVPCRCARFLCFSRSSPSGPRSLKGSAWLSKQRAARAGPTPNVDTGIPTPYVVMFAGSIHGPLGALRCTYARIYVRAGTGSPSRWDGARRASHATAPRDYPYESTCL